jgi:salicylate hydroxylase
MLAVLPHQGQGASAAIEDAEALGHFLRGANRADASQRLRDVFNVRYKRVSYIQGISRTSGLGEMRKSRLAKSGALPETLNPLQFSAFCWNYFGAARWAEEHSDWVTQ